VSNYKITVLNTFDEFMTAYEAGANIQYNAYGADNLYEDDTTGWVEPIGLNHWMSEAVRVGVTRAEIEDYIGWYLGFDPMFNDNRLRVVEEVFAD
jgi:hypothetical protein